jgi:hypothetical protein
MTVLTETKVHEVMRRCLATEASESTLDVQGIQSTYRFDLNALEHDRETVNDMLAELPHQFKVSGGGGASALELCYTRDGSQWADEQRSTDELISLGLALGIASFPLSRDLWVALPGSMPYVTVWPTEQEKA